MTLSKSERTAKKKLFRLMGVKRRQTQKQLTALLRHKEITFKEAVRLYIKLGRWLRSPARTADNFSYVSVDGTVGGYYDTYNQYGLRPIFHV